MFKSDSPVRVRGKKIGVAGVAIVVGATAFIGTHSLTTASAAVPVEKSPQCITRTTELVADPNPSGNAGANEYYERFCYLEVAVDDVYGGASPHLERVSTRVGSIDTGETVVYCQRRGELDDETGNAWRALVTVDEKDASGRWSGWGWVSVEHFSQADSRATGEALLGVPDCDVPAELTTVNLEGVDASLNLAKVQDATNEDDATNDEDATGNADATNTGATSITCEKQNEPITDPNSGETFDQSYLCTNLTDGQVTTPPGGPAGSYEAFGTVEKGATDQLVVCYSSSLSRTESKGHHLLLAKASEGIRGANKPLGNGWGWMSSAVIGAKADVAPANIAECGESSDYAKPIIAAQREVTPGTDACVTSPIRLETGKGHRPTVECDVRASTQVFNRNNGNVFGDIPAGKYQFTCQRQQAVGTSTTSEWIVYTRAASLDSGKTLAKGNGWGYVRATSLVEGQSGGKVPGIPVCANAT